MTTVDALLRVLYLEDNPTDADLTRRHLARLAPEMRLEIVTHLGMALERVAPVHPPFDVVLTDLRLPDGSGLELLAHVRERGLPLAVVILTGSGDQEAAVAALKAGADDYLVKGVENLRSLPRVLRGARDSFAALRERRARPLRVLYAEPHAFDVDLTRRHFLQHAPHIHLEVAASCDAVLARLPLTPAEGAAPVDVLLLDYRLPGLNALELIKTLRQERGLQIPIVLVTGQGSEEVAVQALRLGVDDYLVKREGYLQRLPVVLEHVQKQAELRRYRDHLEGLVTERTRELSAANQRLQEMDRLKSLFIASMSHELRTPLNSIIGFSSILLNEWVGPLNAEQRQNLATVVKAGRHLLTLINDVIDVSKIEAGQIEVVEEEFDLYDLCTEAAGLLVEEARAKGLEFTLEPIHHPLRSDRRRLLQCLLNLISNAVKYTERGTVALRVALQAQAPDRPAKVVLSVVDSGIGIAPEDQARLFIPFDRIDSPLKGRVGGTGLGLYLTLRLARQVLGGEVGFRQNEGGGSIFTLELPGGCPPGEPAVGAGAAP